MPHVRRESVLSLLQIVAAIRQQTNECRTLVDSEALQVSDRHAIERSLDTIGKELDALAAMTGSLLNDPTKTE